VDRVYCNLDGFVIGEVNETFWGIRLFEIAIESGIKHYVWGSLDYLQKKSGYNRKYRCGHYDAKGRVAEFILQQRPKSMTVSVLTSGPYMEMLYEGMFTPITLEDGTLVFAHPMGDGKVPMIHLDDIGRYARWIFDHPEESNGMDLEVATEHVGWHYLVECVQKITGNKAVFKDLEQSEYLAKSGISATTPSAWAHVPGASIPGGQTFWENFSGWWSAWHDNIVTRDYALLDRIPSGPSSDTRGVDAHSDRAALERLARYLLRPAISADRVAVRSDGRVEYRFRRPDPTGRTSWATDGPTLCRRLATLIPPPRGHTVRYHGVFSSAHKLRDRVVPVPPGDEDATAKPPTRLEAGARTRVR